MGRRGISRIKLTPCGEADRARGLRAYVSFDVDGEWRFDGVTLRRTANGDHRISFPARKSRGGAEFPHIVPLVNSRRQEIEDAILNHLAQAGGAS
ncbi:MAG: hypothetical protein JNL28_03605 [Planctomycetes bacterium]|nr:hypothetical protein [Planctomycetota bacterium]